MWGGRSLAVLVVRSWVWGLRYVGHYLMETGFSKFLPNPQRGRVLT